jgi:serine/threonine protein kinase
MLSDAAIERLREVIELPDAGDSRYEIVDRIGEGGMGAVYLARDRELGREVALKVLRVPEPTPEERRRILREARILAALEHPGIVPVHDVGALADGRIFYVMKRVRGERLDTFARGSRPLAERLRVFLQLCDAVAFAHAAGVIHRDLKPQNVMLGAFGEVLVLDWGVARVVTGRDDASRPAAELEESEPIGAGAPGDSTADTATGTVMGTPGYMAPEQVAGAPAVDRRIDVYGLGGLLQFMLTGEHPAAAAAVTGWPDVPPALRSICSRARAPDASRRYPSVADLAADVARYLDGLPVTAHPETVFAKARRLGYRYRTPILLVAAYLLMRIVLLVFS